MLIGLDSPESVFQVAQLCNVGERRMIRRTTHFGSTSSPILKKLRLVNGLLCMSSSRTLLSLTIFHPVNPLFPERLTSLPLAKASARELSIHRENPSSRGARTAPALVFPKTQSGLNRLPLTPPPVRARARMDSSIEGARLPSQTVHARVTHCRYEATNQRSLLVVHSLTRFPSSIFFRRAKKFLVNK